MSFASLLFFLALVRLAISGYVLEDDYSLDNFFDMFSFFTDSDPTHGFVQYVDQGTAQSDGLISTNSDSIYIGVDHTNVQSSGRPSVRLTSQKSYNEGLVILDLAHMPGGACGTWPAFWMVGPNWPSSGEIDIIEGVNEQSTNAMTLHTGPGCSISSGGVSFSGSLGTTNCDVNAVGQSTNAGCQITSNSAVSYGDGFNSNNGGVYATLWTDSIISIYFFPRGSIPSDIESGSPDPSGWGTPQAQFSGACDISSSFKNLQIVFDTTFCGDWAGNVWSSGSCASKASTCTDFVANNPSAFADAYWSINSLRVYQGSVSAESTEPSSAPAAPASSHHTHPSHHAYTSTPDATPVETPTISFPVVPISTSSPVLPVSITPSSIYSSPTLSDIVIAAASPSLLSSAAGSSATPSAEPTPHFRLGNHTHPHHHGNHTHPPHFHLANQTDFSNHTHHRGNHSHPHFHGNHTHSHFPLGTIGIRPSGFITITKTLTVVDTVTATAIKWVNAP